MKPGGVAAGEALSMKYSLEVQCSTVAMMPPVCGARYQAWFAVHGPLLRDCAVQGALWGRSLPLVMSSAPREAAPAAPSEQAGEPVPSAGDAVSRALLADYKSKCISVRKLVTWVFISKD